MLILSLILIFADITLSKIVWKSTNEMVLSISTKSIYFLIVLIELHHFYKKFLSG